MEISLAAFLGRLAGAMINPVGIGIVFAAFYALRHRNIWVQFAAAMGGILIAAFLLYSLDKHLTYDEKVRGATFGLMAGAVWFGIFSAFRYLRGRR